MLIVLKISNAFHKKDFWLEENLRYAEPYFRLEKCARIVNDLARGRHCDLLDVGCGPATLAKLLQKNISYFGIDIAIHEPAPNLLERDFAQNEIRFDSKSFDFIVAAGVFEYLGGLQHKKFSEIRSMLRENGSFVVTYTNFHHFQHRLPAMRAIDDSLYNNIQPIKDFRKDLELFFHVESWFPSSHNWFVSEPRRELLKKAQMPLKTHIPIISRMLAINYFFICSLKNEG